MNTWTVAFNEKSSNYEVHAEGCRHLRASHLVIMSTRQAETGADVRDDFNANNEGCIAKTGPCAR